MANSRRGQYTPDYRRHVVKAPPGRIAVGIDKADSVPGAKRFISFASHEEMLMWYSAQEPKCCYEVLRETAPIALGFDIDFKFANQLHECVRVREGLDRDPDSFLEQLLRRLEAAFPKLAGRTPLKSCSHRAGVKISFHLKYADLFLRDMNDRWAFKLSVGERLGALVPLIDTGIWGLNHNVRLPWSHKMDDASRVLVPEGQSAVWSPDMVAEVKRHMWTFIPPGAVPFCDGHDHVQSRKRGPVPRDGRSIVPRVSPRHSLTMTRDSFQRTYGMTYDAFVRTLEALPAAGGCGSPRRHIGDDVGTSIYWLTERDHTCVHGRKHESDNFLTDIVEGDLVVRACLAEECKSETGHLDWRIIDMLGAQAGSWCSAERPAVEELSPWPLPRHWYFYEPLVQRQLKTDVRCIGFKPVDNFDPSKKDYAAVFHTFLVEYTSPEGHAVRAVIGVCMSEGKLYHRLGPQACKVLHWARRTDGDAVQEHERMEWWFATTWGKRRDGARVDARKGTPELWEPPHSWIVKGLRTCYPWTDLVALQRASTQCV